jgi:hypothetical protein
MPTNLLWKTAVFWVVVLVGLAFAQALIPGPGNWPEAVPFVIILATALVYIWYIKRQQRANPEAFNLSPRARRNYMIAGVVTFAIAAVEMYFVIDAPWHEAVALLCAAAAAASAYRLFKERRGPGTSDLSS